MGSPLAVFLALRGLRPQDNVEDHVLPKSVCKRLVNIYHPADPVVREIIREVAMQVGSNFYSGYQSRAPSKDFFPISKTTFWWTSIKCIHDNNGERSLQNHYFSVISRSCSFIFT